MKRHIQKTGVRKFFGQDLIDLQNEPLKALDTFFTEFGACVIQGCETTSVGDNIYDIAPGLVALAVTDPEAVAPQVPSKLESVSDAQPIPTIKVMPFVGANGVSLPIYLTATVSIDERVYIDGKVKPIAYNYHAIASGIEPATPYLELTESGCTRFVDALQDDTHTFITAAERSKWNAILQAAKDYTDTHLTESATANLAAAKTYTDTKTATANSYTDSKVADIVNSAPETLDTLKELSTALGDDPNFATTIATQIGGKADKTHVHNASQISGLPTSLPASDVHAWAKEPGKPSYSLSELGFDNYQHTQTDANLVYANGGSYADNRSTPHNWSGVYTMHTHGNHYIQLAVSLGANAVSMRSTVNGTDRTWQPWITLYHSGNMSDLRKIIISGHVNIGGTALKGKGLGAWRARRTGLGNFRVDYTFGHTNYIVTATGLGGCWASVVSYDANGFDIRTGELGSIISSDFTFVVYEI